MPARDAALWPLSAALDRVWARAGSVTALGEQWQTALDDAVRRWQEEVSPAHTAAAVQQVETAARANDADALTTLRLPVLGDAIALDGMRATSAAGIDSVLAEARAAGLDLPAPPPLAALTLADWARVAAETLASGLGLAVGREALRLLRPGATAAEVVEGVRTYLSGLGDRGLRDVLGGALTRAQNLGRLAVYVRPLPPRWRLQLVADETLDRNTCEPCREIDGTVLPSFDAAMLAYGGAGYLYCKGGERCRGTMRGEWIRDDRPAEDRFVTMLAGPDDAALARFDAILHAHREAADGREGDTIMRFNLTRLHNLATEARARMAPREPEPRTEGKSWYRIDNAAPAAGEATEVYIYDEIGLWGVTAADFATELGAIKASAINLRINSPGGDVFDGVAIFESMVRHPARIVAHVDGIAASTASFILQAADEAIVAPQGRVMVHDAHGFVVGNGRDMRAMATLFEDVSDAIADIYAASAAARGGPATRAEWRTIMQAADGGPDGTWFDARGAVQAGLADSVRGEGGDRGTVAPTASADALPDWRAAAERRRAADPAAALAPLAALAEISRERPEPVVPIVGGALVDLLGDLR